MSASAQPKRRQNAGAASNRRRKQIILGKPTNTNNQSADKTSATHQAQSITTSLLRTKNMMSSELERISTLNTTITDEGALLSSTKDEHAGMGGTMKGAKGVMNKLGRQDIRDAFILKCAIILYWMVVGYVLWSRIKVPFLP